MLSSLLMFSLLGSGDDFRSNCSNLPKRLQPVSKNRSSITPVNPKLLIKLTSGSICGTDVKRHIAIILGCSVKARPDAHTLGVCASMSTPEGLLLRTKQEEGVAALYQYFTDLHLVVDTRTTQLFSIRICSCLTHPSPWSQHQACKPNDDHD